MARRTQKPSRRWSAEVTRTSHALDLEPAVFAKPTAIGVARSLRRSAETSTHRKSDAFRSAMSMLTFYLNRAGSRLPEERRRLLEAAKDELRRLYGRPVAARSRRRSEGPVRNVDAAHGAKPARKRRSGRS